MYKIDKNIPMPSTKGRFPFHKMEVKDSFFVPLSDTKCKDLQSLHCVVKNAANKYNQDNELKRAYSIAKDIENMGVRIWRVK